MYLNDIRPINLFLLEILHDNSDIYIFALSLCRCSFSFDWFVSVYTILCYRSINTDCSLKTKVLLPGTTFCLWWYWLFLTRPMSCFEAIKWVSVSVCTVAPLSLQAVDVQNLVWIDSSVTDLRECACVKKNAFRVDLFKLTYPSVTLSRLQVTFSADFNA